MGGELAIHSLYSKLLRSCALNKKYAFFFIGEKGYSNYKKYQITQNSRDKFLFQSLNSFLACGRIQVDVSRFVVNFIVIKIRKKNNTFILYICVPLGLMFRGRSRS